MSRGAELGTGWIRIAADVSSISPEIAKAIDKSQAAATKSGEGLGSKLAGGIGGALKKSTMAIGVAAGGTLATGIGKGIGRLNAIENAESKLTGLGNSTRDVAGIMENALSSVKGTAYGLDAAATTAAMVVASGVKPGKELETVLKTVADTAGIAGASMDDMGMIFGSVAARGKLQGDDMMQLTSRGIPVLQMLADQYGVTAEEASKMVSEGKVDFANFEEALRTHIGGAALEAGKTTSGALANAWAAWGRFGANLAGPFYNQAAGALTGITGYIDGLNDSTKPLIDNFDAWLSGDAVPRLKEFAGGMKEAASGFIQSDQFTDLASQTAISISGIVDAGTALLPVVGQMAGALSAASAALGLGAWQLFLTTLDIAGTAAEAITPPLEMVAGLMREHPGIVAAAMAGWAAFKTVPGFITPITKTLETQTSKFSNLRAGVSDLKTYYAETGREISTFDATMQLVGTSSNKVLQAIGQGYSQASGPLKEFAANQRKLGAEAAQAALEASNGWDAADRIMAQAGHSMSASFASFGGTLKGVTSGAIKGAKAGIGELVNVMGGPLAVGIGAAVWALNDIQTASRAAEASQKAIAEATRDAARAQEELIAAAAGTSGALDDKGLAAAARVAKGSLAEMVEVGQQKMSFVDNIAMSTVVVDELAGKLPGLTNEAGRASTEMTRQTKDTREAYEALTTVADEMGMSLEDVYAAAAKGGPEFNSMVSQLRAMGPEGERAADQLMSARESIDTIVESAQRIDPAFAGAAEAVGVLADKSSSATDRLGALESLMESMGLVPKQAEEAMMDAAEAVDKVVEAASSGDLPVNTLGDALFGLNGKLDPSNESARMLHDTLGGLRGELQQVAISGGDTQAAFEMMDPALESIKTQFGLTDQQLQQLIDSYGLMPDVVNTAVNLQGASEAVQDLAAVWSQLDGLPKDESINVGVLDEGAVATLEELGYKVESLPDGDFEVYGNTDEANANLQTVIDRMATLEGTDVDVSLAMDNTQFTMSADQAQSLIDNLVIQDPTVQTDMIIEQLQSKHSIAMGDLAVLASKTPTPIADLAKQLLDNGVKDANGKLTNLANQKPKPVIDADVGPLERAVNWAKGLLAGLTGKTLSIGGVAGHYSGGRIPAFASGGKLPVSGPGTYQVDGILGVDNNGMAVARVNRGEWVVTEKRSDRFNNTIGAINSGTDSQIVDAMRRDIPNFDQLAGRPLQALAGGGVIGSITDIVKKHFPMMTITSTQRNSADYHGQGKAVDFSNGTDTTPEMQRAAKFFADNYGGELLELIHSPFNTNIKNGKSVGDGFGFYGSATMAQHRNHVHVAANAPLGSPKKLSLSITDKDADSTDIKAPTSDKMTWTAAEDVKVSFGSAQSIYDGVARAMGIKSERQKVQVGKSYESRESVTPSSTDPLKGDKATARTTGWGHDFFVEEIARNAKSHDLPERGAMIGVGTAFVEAGNPLRMWANRAVPDSLQYRHDSIGSDHDSVGLFQQRQAGWGTLAQRMSPFDSAGLFFNAMLRKFPNWADMDPGAVAQGVQVSAFPDRYGKVMGAALESVRKTSLYDQGGWLKHGHFAENRSGKPEPVLTNNQWGDVSGMLAQMPYLIGSIDRLIPVLAAVAATGQFKGGNGVKIDENSPLIIGAKKLYKVGQDIEAQADRVAQGYERAGLELTRWTSKSLTFFDNTQIVMDAEEGLRATREQAAADVESISLAEEQLAKAKKNFAEVQGKDAGLKTTTQRKLADAERALADAHKASASTAKESASKAKKIENAERKLARAREDAAKELEKSEDSNAKATIDAMEDVAKAEENLSNARENAEGAAKRIEAAERTLAGARISVIQDVLDGVRGAVDSAFASFGQYIDEMTRLAGIVEETQQTVSNLAMAQVNLNLSSIKSANDLRVAEWDVAKTRLNGMVDVAVAEAELAKARDGHIVMGATSVDALGSAVDRFRVLGMDAADQLGTSVVVNAKEIALGEAKLAKARADAALADLEAQHRARAAATAAAKATIIQAQSAEILEAQTVRLAQQTAQLHGMNNTQQTALQQRVQGGQKTAGGVLKIIGAIAMGAAGVATMNPALIAGAIGIGASGIGDTVTGATILKNHDKKAADEAWAKLPTSEKVQIGLGAAGGTIVSAAGVAAGAYTGNAEWVTAGLDAGAQIWETATTSLAAQQQAAFDRIEAQYQDSITAVNNAYDARLAGLDAQQTADEADYLMKREALLAESDLRELEKRIAEASSKAETEALVRAAEVAEARRDDLVAAARETNRLLKQNVTVQIPAGQAWTSDQLEAYLTELFAQFNGIAAEVEQFREERKPNGLDIIMSQR